MSITRQLILLMNGLLRVQSELDKGSKFTVYLPMVNEAQSANTIFTDIGSVPPVEDFLAYIFVVGEKTLFASLLKHLEPSTRDYSQFFSYFPDPASATKAIVNFVKQQSSDLNGALGSLHNLPLLVIVNENQASDLAQQKDLPDNAKNLFYMVIADKGYRGQAQQMQKLGFHGYLTRPFNWEEFWQILCAVMNPKEWDQTKQSAKQVTEQQDSDDGPKIVTKYWFEHNKEKNKIISEKLGFNIVGHLLLVEDNIVNQVLAEKMLLKLGYTVDVVDNGQKALDMLANASSPKSKVYQLVLMDIQMPIMDGYTATQKIRQMEGKVKDIPIIAMTAGARQEDKQQALDAGMNDFITKPVRMTELADMIKKYLTND